MSVYADKYAVRADLGVLIADRGLASVTSTEPGCLLAHVSISSQPTQV